MNTMNKCYSTNDEEFDYDSLGEAIEAMDDPKPGDVYWEADCEPLGYRDVADSWVVESLLENMDARAHDEVGGCYSSDCSEVGQEAKDELLEFLQAWVQRHTNLSRYWKLVGQSRRMQLTAEDLE